MRSGPTRRILAWAGFLSFTAALELLANIARAETIRVTSWNLGLSSQTSDATRIVQKAANTLRSLDPDIVLLQGVQDWRMCSQLADLLRPADYNVLVCSDFRATTSAAPDESQVAILSKRKAYFTWAESWPSQEQLPQTRGVAFAAIQSGSQRLGFFSALAPNHRSANELARKVLAQIDSIGHWETNQVQTFVIAASFDPEWSQSAKVLHRAEVAFDRAGFVNATEEFPADSRATLRPDGNSVATRGDFIFAGTMGFPANARITTTPFTEHYPTTCELELDPEKVNLALDIRAEKRREKRARVDLLIRRTEYGVAGILGCGLAIGGTIGLRKRRARAAALRRSGSPVQAASKIPSAPLRPIVFVQPPAKPPASAKAPATQNRLPALRLQSPPRINPETIHQPPPLPAAPTPAPPQESPPEKKTLPHDIVSPGAHVLQESDVRHGVIRELSSWLKHKLLRKLVTDRAELMAAQQLAARMANTLDNRLARIEAQIQQQNQAYVRRIEELNKELAAAREENRELIRERIAQVKAEMEAARARVLAEAHLDNKSLRL